MKEPHSLFDHTSARTKISKKTCEYMKRDLGERPTDCLIKISARKKMDSSMQEAITQVCLFFVPIGTNISMCYCYRGFRVMRFLCAYGYRGSSVLHSLCPC